MFQNRTFLLLPLLVALTACAATKTSLPKELQSEINTLRVVSFVPQEELDSQMKLPNSVLPLGVQGGAIGALIGSIIDATVISSRAKKAEAAIEPYRSALNGYEPQKELQSALENASRNIGWAKITDFVTDIRAEEFDLAEYLANIEEDGLMLLSSKYSFTPGLESLEIFTWVEIYRSTALIKQKVGSSSSSANPERPIYKSGLKYQSKYYSEKYTILGEDAVAAEIAAVKQEFADRIAKSVGRKSSLQTLRNKKLKVLQRKRFTKNRNRKGPTWLENEGELLVNTLNEGVKIQADLLQVDLEHAVTETAYKNRAVDIPIVMLGASNEILSDKSKGWRIAEDDNRKTIRLNNGVLYSIDKAEYIRPTSGLLH